MIAFISHPVFSVFLTCICMVAALLARDQVLIATIFIFVSFLCGCYGSSKLGLTKAPFLILIFLWAGASIFIFKRIEDANRKVPTVKYAEIFKRPDGPPNREMIIRVYVEENNLSDPIVWLGFIQFNENDFSKDKIIWISEPQIGPIQKDNTQSYNFDITSDKVTGTIAQATYRVACMQSKQFPNGLNTKIRYTDTLEENHQKWWPYENNKGAINPLYFSRVNALLKNLNKEGVPS